jgi:hypothetical protein
MANTLTNLVPDLYSALDVVSRELVGFIPSVTLDSDVERAAVGQTVRSFVAPASTATNVTPGVTPPNDGDQVLGNKFMTITKSRRVPVRYNGEEQRGLNSGPGYNSILQNQFAQAMRTLSNEMESDLASLYTTTSRAFGTPGTTPFASDLSDTAEVRKILVDNGAPISDLQLVMNTTAGAKMRTLTQLTKANEAADTTLLRQGVLLDVHGMAIRESAQTKTHVKGTANTSYVTNGTFAVGVSTIAVDTGSGTILAGDVITFAGDTNKYVVDTALASGSLVIGLPGLRQPLADGVAVTIGAAYSANAAFSRSAIVLANRLPARPEEGDQAEDVMSVVDPRSGITFEVALYKQYRQVQYEISAAWGVKNFKTEHTATLLG